MSNPVVERINTISNGQCIALSLVLGAMYYWMYFDSGDTIQEQTKKIQQEIRKSDASFNALTKAEEDARRFQTVIAQMGERLGEVTKYIPEKLNDFDLMGILSAEAQAAGVNISNVSSLGAVKASAADAIYEEVVVTVDLSGTYTQLLTFLSYITRTDKIVVLKSATLTTTSERTTSGEAIISFNGKFAGYRYVAKDTGGAE